MKRFIYLLLFCACASMYCVPAYAWGQEGHRIIAKIAYDHLSRKARKNIDRLLGEQGMIYWANWADEIKSDTIYARSIRDGWHYQDFEAGMSMNEICIARTTNYPSEGGNLFRALDSIVEVVRTENRDRSHAADRAESIDRMRFIIHLTADLYCPMHMAHMSDKGGNAVKMKWFGSNTNLHTVWDSKLIESQGYCYTEYADMLEKRFGSKQYNRTLCEEAEWCSVWRTYEITSAIYEYQQNWDGNTYHYIYRWKGTMESQLYIAGIRLAKLLNELF